MSPLTSLLKKNNKYLWKKTCDKDFAGIKSILISNLVLSSPDCTRQFKLVVDASDVELMLFYYKRLLKKSRRLLFFEKKLNEYQKIIQCLKRNI